MRGSHVAMDRDVSADMECILMMRSMCRLSIMHERVEEIKSEMSSKSVEISSSSVSTSSSSRVQSSSKVEENDRVDVSIKADGEGSKSAKVKVAVEE